MAELGNLKSVRDENAPGIAQAVENAASDMATKTKDFVSNTTDKVKNAIEHSPDIIKQYPLQSMLVGFGAGFVLAMAFFSRSKA